MDADQINKEVLLLWQRYQDLARQVYALQATVAELVGDMEKVSTKLQKLYHESDDKANGEG